MLENNSAEEDSSSSSDDDDGDDQTVVVLKETAEWLHYTFGVPGFVAPAGGSSKSRRLQRRLLCDDGDGESGEPISSYANAKDFDQPCSFDAYLAKLPGKPEAALDAITTVTSCIKGTTVCKQLKAALAAAVRGELDDAELLRSFRALYDANAPLMREGGRPGRYGLKAICALELTCVDRRALEPLLSGEVLRFDILPRLLVAAGWSAAPGADSAEAWYLNKAYMDRRELKPKGWSTDKDKPVSETYAPDFGLICLDSWGEPNGDSTLCLRPSRDKKWWGTPEARAGFARADWERMHRNWLEMQPALALIECDIEQQALFKVIGRNKDGCHAVMNELQDMRDKAVEGRWLHRIVPYGQKLSSYRHHIRAKLQHPKKVVLVCMKAGRKLWDDVLLAYVFSPNSDHAQLRSSFIAQVGGLYAIMVSTLLSVFVQQSCPDATAAGAHSCSFYEKTSADLAYNRRYWPRLVLGWNCITFITFVLTNYLLYTRESFLIESFNHAKNLPEEYLHGRVRVKPNLTARPARDEDGCMRGTLLGKACDKVDSAVFALRFPPTKVTVGAELERYPKLMKGLERYNAFAYASTALCLAFLTVKCAACSSAAMQPACIMRHS